MKSIKTITILLQSNIILIMINYHDYCNSSARTVHVAVAYYVTILVRLSYIHSCVIELIQQLYYIPATELNIRWFSCSSQFIQIYHAGYSSCNLTNASYTAQCNLQYCYWSFYSEVSESYVFPNTRAARYAIECEISRHTQPASKSYRYSLKYKYLRNVLYLVFMIFVVNWFLLKFDL